MRLTAHFQELRPYWRGNLCRNQNWGIRVFTKGGIPKRGIDFEGGIILLCTLCHNTWFTLVGSLVVAFVVEWFYIKSVNDRDH